MRNKRPRPTRPQLAILCSIAEVLIKELVDTEPSAKSLLMDSMECGHCRLVEVLVNQAPLHDTEKFDPEHGFDLSLVLDDGREIIIMPVEVKAGFETPVIKECKGAMFAIGNMMAIYGGLTRIASLAELKIKYQEKEIRVDSRWGLIARRSVLDKLRKTKKLQRAPLELALEDICSCVSDEQFTKVVNRILKSEDYRSDWFLK